MARVLVTRVLPEGGLDPLHRAHHEVVQRSDDTPYTHGELVAAAPSVDAIVCLLTDRIDEEVLEAGKNGRLQVAANVAVGYDNIDVRAARRFGVAVCNTPGVLDESVADLTFMLLLGAARLASEAERDLRSGTWTGWGMNEYLGREVHGAVLGLVGYGRIARAVASRAGGFSMTVIHHARGDTGFEGYVGDLDELLARSDFVSLHVPLTPETHHLIGKRQIARMRPNAVLVNTSRGQVLDELALAAALEEGRIFAAGLDVYENEPRVHPPLLAAPRTMLLPHIASATQSTRVQMARTACESVCEVLAGRAPPTLVT